MRRGLGAAPDALQALLDEGELVGGARRRTCWIAGGRSTSSPTGYAPGAAEQAALMLREAPRIDATA